ncbi:MAG: LamG-like jellyroll fold domain-containing protein [Patescibacteria group bacterium]
MLPLSILLSFIFLPPSAQSASCLPLPSDAAHWWRAEGNAQDSLGLNHGALEGGTLYEAGKVGQGFSFDGIDDLVQIPTQGFPAGASDRTLEVWVKIDALVVQEAYFAGYGLFGATGASYNIGASFGRLYFSSWGPDLFGPQVELGQWHHVAVTNVGSFVTLYLDGVSVNSASLPIDVPPEGTQFFIGKVGGEYGDIRRLQGQVDEVSLYTRALTAEEIAAIYQAGSLGKCAPGSPANHPPILSFSQETGYVTDGINPDKGTANLTPLAFKVIYTDHDNDPPQSLLLHIDTGTVNLDPIPLIPDTGDTVPSILKDGNFSNGEQYAYTSTFPKGNYQYHFETSDGETTARLPAAGELNFTVDYQPVILIHGIAGSRNLDVMFGGILSNNWKLNGNAYLDLIHTLTDAGYTQGQDLFIAFYDWRQDNAQSAAQYLVPIIDEAKSRTGQSKVDIVAHSMGGLVARSYIQSAGYRNDVDQLLLIGTPNQGSSDSYLIWEGGQLPEDWSSSMKWIVRAYVEYLRDKLFPPQTTVSAIQENIPSIGQLLPTYGFLVENDTNNVITLANPYLDGLNAGIGTLSPRVGDLLVIAGDEVATIEKILVEDRSSIDALQNQWEHGKPNPNPPLKDSQDGDNRVLLSSASILSVTRLLYGNGRHDRLPTLAQQDVVEALMGTRPSTIYDTPDPSRILGVMVASPVEIEITDSEGKMVSRTLSEIPGAEFDAETNPMGVKMIMIPDPGDGVYTIKLAGTDNGTYHLITAFIDEDTDSSKTFTGEARMDEIIEYRIILNGESNEIPLVTEIIDGEPPAAVITQPQDNSTHSDAEILPMELVSADRLSGIKESRLFFDGAVFAASPTPTTTASADLSLVSLGMHTVRGEADDRAGNTTSTEVTIISITSFDDTIRNIEHYETLGLLSIQPKVKQFLVVQLKAAKTLAQQYVKRPLPKLKIAVNTILLTLTKEVEILEQIGMIDPRAASHLKEAFVFLKIP